MTSETQPALTSTEPSKEDLQDQAVKSPFCRELRSNRYYFLQSMPTEEHHLLDASGHCWCRRTMQAAGPDGERANPRDCKPGRACYLSLFDE